MIKLPKKDPNKSLLYNEVKGVFRALPTKAINKLTPNTTVKNPEPTKIDGWQLISWADGQRLADKMNERLQDPPEATKPKGKASKDKPTEEVVQDPPEAK